MTVAAGCGPTWVQGTERGALAAAVLNEETTRTRAGAIAVESTEPQKSPASTYTFVALTGTESSTA